MRNSIYSMYRSIYRTYTSVFAPIVRIEDVIADIESVEFVLVFVVDCVDRCRPGRLASEHGHVGTRGTIWIKSQVWNRPTYCINNIVYLRLVASACGSKCCFLRDRKSRAWPLREQRSRWHLGWSPAAGKSPPSWDRISPGCATKWWGPKRESAPPLQQRAGGRKTIVFSALIPSICNQM